VCAERVPLFAASSGAHSPFSSLTQRDLHELVADAFEGVADELARTLECYLDELRELAEDLPEELRSRFRAIAARLERAVERDLDEFTATFELDLERRAAADLIVRHAAAARAGEGGS
jgi:hypothetical protein